MNLNKAMIIGNLTKDPEIRTTPNGTTVASFGIATNSVWTDQSGQRQERVEYHNIVAWKRLAEICGQYLHKGSKIFIEGRLQTRDWVGQDGIKRYRTEIIAENMIMLDRAGAGSSSPMSHEVPPMPSEHLADYGDTQSNNEYSEEEIKVENIPF
jgi:single-strand DNA-binding protein